MSRLPRPRIPQPIQLTVALRQLSECHPSAIKAYVDGIRLARRIGVRLAQAKESLAHKFGCAVSDLQLDHNPALENREKIIRNGDVVGFKPDANDPEFLFYRPYGPEFAGSHKIKTLVRGDRGQHSDLALNNKLKNIAKNRDPKRRKAKIPQRKNPWPKGRAFRA